MIYKNCGLQWDLVFEARGRYRLGRLLKRPVGSNVRQWRLVIWYTDASWQEWRERARGGNVSKQLCQTWRPFWRLPRVWGGGGLSNLEPCLQRNGHPLILMAVGRLDVSPQDFHGCSAHLKCRLSDGCELGPEACSPIEIIEA